MKSEKLTGLLRASAWLPAAFFFLAAAPAPAAGGKIIAVYGNAVYAAEAPPGWGFYWNAGGPADEPAGYLPLIRDGQSLNYGVPGETGALAADKPGHSRAGDVLSVRDVDGRVRCAIVSYTMQEDSGGEVWVSHGNFLNRFFPGTILEIRLNDRLVSAVVLKSDLTAPHLFQENLGVLKKGDTIRVVASPGEGAGRGGGRLRFTIEEFPAGEAPGEPANILSPAITAAEPQRSADGRFDAYLARHRAQCEAVLARRPELVFLGDSITARWPAELLERRFGKHRPVNLGIGGDWVQNVLWRVRNGVLGEVPVKVIVILIGTNNLSNRFTPEEVAEGIGLLVGTLREITPESRLLLLGILPRRATPGRDTGERIIRVNEKLARLADGKTVFFLDVGDALIEPDGSISNEVMPDGLHVALPGFNRWLDAMGPMLDRLLAEPAVIPGEEK